MPRPGLLLLAFVAGLLGAAAPLPADAAVFIVRHAERKSSKDDGSTLSREGFKRAGDLKDILASVDLKAVYCTEYERTRQTGEPTALAKGLEPIEISSEDLPALVKAIRSHGEDADVLVVGHTDTIPDLLKELGVAQPLELPSEDFDNLFIVTFRGEKAPAFTRLHY